MKNFILTLLGTLVFSVLGAFEAQAQYRYNLQNICTVQTRDLNGYVNVRYLPTVRSIVIATVPNQGYVLPIAKVYYENFIWVGVRVGEQLGFIRSDLLSPTCLDVPWIH